MSSSLNVIALISGGKDSFFSLQHCLAHGHNIVALANLHPTPTPNDADLDSYMYQTVGHAVIPLYADALGIPLYRQEITGKAINSSRDYSQQEQDETEDLVPLLQRIKRAHPQADAVSSGAILSTYQRTRVESVALRLGLTPLAFLWQYPVLPPYSQTALLRDMAAARLEAVIIKTASGGLDERFLGCNVAAARTIGRLQAAMARFGETGNGAVVGEGGEFETLALDGPRPLWKKRVRIQAGDAEVLGGGQAVLRIEGSEVEEKSGDEDGGDAGSLRIPELFDDEFKRILDAAETSSGAPSSAADDATLGTLSITNTPWPSFDTLPRNTPGVTPAVFTLSNLTSPAASTSTPAEQLSAILARLSAALTQHQVPFTAINHCTLLLRNMADFTLLNPLYASFFTAINPPSRVTVAAGPSMPEGIDVMLSVVADTTTTTTASRQALHVQGRSYWAPANIGPYSQSVSAALPPPSPPRANDPATPPSAVTYLAGQIPLVPASMAVYTSRGFPGQATLALQHVWRIGRAVNVCAWAAGVAYISACGADEARARVGVLQRVWSAAHALVLGRGGEGDDGEGSEDDDDDEVDPWDRLNTHATPFNDTTYRAPLPCAAQLRFASARPRAPLCFVVQVEALPRDVDVEWSATGVTGADMAVSFTSSASTLSLAASSASFRALEMHGAEDVEGVLRKGEKGRWVAATLYVGRGFEGVRTGTGTGEGEEGMWEGVQWVPCRRVWGQGGRECCAVLVGRWEGGREN